MRHCHDAYVELSKNMVMIVEVLGHTFTVQNNPVSSLSSVLCPDKVVQRVFSAAAMTKTVSVTVC